MKTLFTMLVAFIFSLSLGLTSYANEAKNEERSNTQESGKFVTKASAFTYKANDIIGAKVQDRDGKSLGTISDLGIDPKTDRVAFAVLAHSGVVGIGEKDIAVPLKALSLRTDEKGRIKMFVLNMSEDRFKNAPSFDKNSWPDKESAAKSYKYFGQSPYWSADHRAATDQSTSDRMKNEKK